MRYSFLFVLLFSLHSFAQDCDQALLREKPGTWKADLKGQIINVTPTDLAKEKKVLGDIHKMVTEHYSPIGCQVLYATVFGKHLLAAQNWAADPYYYSMYILRFLCDPGSADKSKSYVDISTPTTVNIAVNQIQSLYMYAADLAADDFRGYVKLTKRPQKKDGFYYLGEHDLGSAGMGNRIKEYRWLVTYGDTLPFVYMNRKDYLLIQKKRLEKDIEESPRDKKWYETYLKNIDEYLKNHADELQLPAIAMWNDEERFEKFVEEGTYGSFIAVKPNPAYYRKNLPKSTPQFFNVVYKISHGDPVFEENIDRIKKAVDLSALRNMLGK